MPAQSLEIAVVTEALSNVINTFREANREYTDIIKEIKKDPFQKEIAKRKKSIQNEIIRARKAADAIEDLTHSVKSLTDAQKRGETNLKSYRRSVMSAADAAKKAGAVIDKDLVDSLNDFETATVDSTTDLSKLSKALTTAADMQEKSSEAVAKGLKGQMRSTAIWEKLDQLSSVPKGLGLVVAGITQMAGDVKEARGMGIPSFVDEISNIDVAALAVSVDEGRKAFNENFTILAAMTKDMKHVEDPWIQAQKMMTGTMIKLSDGTEKSMHEFFRDVTETPAEALKVSTELTESIRSIDPASTFEETADAAKALAKPLTLSARIARKSVPAQAELFKQYNQSAEVQAALMGMNEQQQKDFKNQHLNSILANQELGKMPEAIMEANKALMATRKSINPMEWRKQMAIASVVLTNAGVKNVDRMLELMEKKSAGIDIGSDAEEELLGYTTAARGVLEKIRTEGRLGNANAQAIGMTLTKMEGSPFLADIEGRAKTPMDEMRALGENQLGVLRNIAQGIKVLSGTEKKISQAEKFAKYLFEEFLNDPIWKVIAGIGSAVLSGGLALAGPALMGASWSLKGAATALTAAAARLGMAGGIGIDPDGPDGGKKGKKGGPTGKKGRLGRVGGKISGGLKGLGNAAKGAGRWLAPRAAGVLGTAGAATAAGLGTMLYSPGLGGDGADIVPGSTMDPNGKQNVKGRAAPADKLTEFATGALNKAEIEGLRGVPSPMVPKPAVTMPDEDWSKPRIEKETAESMEKLDSIASSSSSAKDFMSKLLSTLVKTNELLDSQSEFYEAIVKNTKYKKAVGLS